VICEETARRLVHLVLGGIIGRDLDVGIETMEGGAGPGSSRCQGWGRQE